MLRHETMLDEVGQTVGSSVIKKTSTARAPFEIVKPLRQFNLHYNKT